MSEPSHEEQEDTTKLAERARRRKEKKAAGSGGLAKHAAVPYDKATRTGRRPDDAPVLPHELEKLEKSAASLREYIRAHRCPPPPQLLMELHALYMQATNGDAPDEPPAANAPEQEKRRWRAWNIKRHEARGSALGTHLDIVSMVTCAGRVCVVQQPEAEGIANDKASTLKAVRKGDNVLARARELAASGHDRVIVITGVGIGDEEHSYEVLGEKKDNPNKILITGNNSLPILPLHPEGKPHIYQIYVPADHWPGDKFLMQIDGQALEFTVPPGAEPFTVLHIPQSAIMEATPRKKEPKEEALTTITPDMMPNTIKKIGESAFRDCTTLTSVIIPDHVEEIGERAFQGCSSLTAVTIPNSVNQIGEGVFAYCSSLTSLMIPDSVETIGLYAFLGCTSLTSVTIPDSVKHIGPGAFRDCSSLTAVSVPYSVKKIGNRAFYGCSALTELTIPDLSNLNIGVDVWDPETTQVRRR